jgi:hypothetical protein
MTTSPPRLARTSAGATARCPASCRRSPGVGQARPVHERAAALDKDAGEEALISQERGDDLDADGVEEAGDPVRDGVLEHALSPFAVGSPAGLLRPADV